jgi:hypothetical protein
MAQAAAADGTRIPFVSACPRCGHEQAQWYSHRTLTTLLRRGHPVEGYRVLCQEYWQLNTRELEGLVAKLSS